MSVRIGILVGSILAFLLVIGFGIAMAIIRIDPAPAMDQWWESVMVSARNPAITPFALFLDFFGNGWIARVILPVLVIAALLVFRRPWSALFFAVCLIASVIAVQTIKNLVGRPRPLHALVQSDFGSYPSGHVANAVTLVVALGLITRFAWVWLIGAIYAILMLLSRTYLGIHWLTDTLASVLLGAAVVLLLALVFSTKLHGELTKVRTPHAPR